MNSNNKKNLKDYNLGFFMTEGLSLERWYEIGMFHREIEPYNKLAKHFNKIYFFTYGNNKDKEFNKYFESNIEIVPLGIKIPFIPLNFLIAFLFPLLKYNYIKKCHFIKFNQMKGSQAGVIVKKINKKIIFVSRSGYVWSLFAQKKNKYFKIAKFIEKLVYKNCDISFVASSSDKRYIEKEYNPNKIDVIPNFINIDKFKSDRGVEKYQNRILFVGRLNKQKNLFALMEALKGTEVGLDIIGSGELKDELEGRAKKFEVKINFLGNFPNSELPVLLNRYEIFVLPSHYEGTPKTLLEAMSCGLLCLATNVEGSRDIVQDGINGIISETDYKDLRGKIIYLVENKNNLEDLREKARTFIEENYSLDEQIKKEIKIYKDFIQN
ncbi:glycosyltransferase [bacterium]|nr:glycosyltransferase [bacterium]